MRLKVGILLFIVLALSQYQIVTAQSFITGNIIDHQGAPIPYATVRVMNSSDGTISSDRGDFKLELNQESEIEVSYLGYESARRTVNPGDSITITLQEKIYNLDEVAITADREDPAYPIIRKAIERRDSHRKSIDQYSAQLYIKGLVKLIDAPSQILGNEIGTLGGILDSTGTGIIYLSESISDFYFKQPDQIKEVIISSKLAESDNGFSFNTIQQGYFNIYDEYFHVMKTIVLPLSDNALTFYRYRLEGISVEEDGRQLYKIAVIPKSSTRPLFSGMIYIYGDTYNVDRVDLNLKGNTINIPVLGTLNISQDYITIDGKEVLFTQKTAVDGGIFGFQFSGAFNFLFSDYHLEDPAVDDINFTEAIRAEGQSNQQPARYWEENRPIPLSEVEVKEYDRKDSLKAVWTSKSYLDSIDRVNNKVGFMDIISGYTYSDSYRNRSFSYSGLSSFRYNPVEGHSLGTSVEMNQSDTSGYADYSIKGGLRYGIADRKFKGDLSYRKQLSSIRRSYFSIQLEDRYNQLCNCGQYPVPVLYNTFAALVTGQNEIKYYRHTGAQITYGSELFNGLYLNATASYSRRKTLSNHIDRQPWFSNKPYEANDNPLDFTPGYAMKSKVQMRYYFKQRYMIMGDRKSVVSRVGPGIRLSFERGWKVLNADSEFNLVELRVNDNYQNLNYLGDLSYSLSLGKFFGRRNMNNLDGKFFVSNAFLIVPREWYDQGFKRLPHYSYNAYDEYFHAYFDHDFDGLILNTIPVINKLGFEMRLSGTYLRSDSRNYGELAIGVDDIGWGLFRFIRLDYVWSFNDDGLSKKGFIIGIKIN